MSAVWDSYWPVVLVGLVIGVIVGFLIFRPRQRVALSDQTPLRPHMMQSAAPAPAAIPPSTPVPTPAKQGRGLSDEAAAAASDVAGQMLNSNVRDELPGATGTPDNLQLMKGVGPKMASMLNAHGLTRFDQIAKLTPGQVESIDAAMGAFRGRFARDRIVEQAHYLARGDDDGYRALFGAL